MASNDMHRSIGTYRTANLVDLKSLSEVCRHGPSPRIAAARPDKHWESVRNQIFEEVRDRALIRVPHQDRALLDRIGYLSIQGRKAASTGDKVESRRLFASAQEALTKPRILERKLICSVLLSKLLRKHIWTALVAITLAHITSFETPTTLLVD